MAVRVFLDRAALLREARRLSTPERVQIAHEAAGDAVASAPVESGEYRDGISVKVDGDLVQIVDEDPEAFWKEYGTVQTPAHATLTEAAKNYGRYSGMKPRGRP
jgi:hypothetical protein